MVTCFNQRKVFLKGRCGDRKIERVTGVYYQISKNCEDLLKLLDSGWTFDGVTEPDPESNQDADITLIHGKGILVPEPDNAVDSDAIAVYLKFISKDPNKKPTTECMIKISYLPKDSKLKKRITRPVQVSLDCRARCYFQAKVVGVPWLSRNPKGFIKDIPALNID